MKDRFFSLLLATKREGVADLLQELENGGFFTAPCSGSNHLAKEGGLLEHSINVYENMKCICAGLCYDVPADTLAIVSLLHDVGKMGDYGKSYYVPNYLKNGSLGAKPYTQNKDLLKIPHEIKSIVIAERFIRLTEAEEHAILFHNGKYDALGYVMTETPLQMALHAADMWASRVTEVSTNGV